MHKRREFLKLSAGATLGASFLGSVEPLQSQNLPEPLKQLKPMMDGIIPITNDERKTRIEKAQRLMVENNIGAIFLEPGTSVYYFTGLRTWISERMIALVIPAKGELGWVCPKFEEDRMREVIKMGTDIRTWEEDESPFSVVSGIFKDRGVRTGTVGIEERVRFFLYDGIRKETSGIEFASADPITAGCRMIKSPAEIALMQKANDKRLWHTRRRLRRLRKG
jgi:Xaa-Pro dipeptidase